MITEKKEVVMTKKVETTPVEQKAENNPKENKSGVMAMIEKFKPNVFSAEERIERIAHFEAHSKRFKLLKEKANDLKMFDAGNDKTNAKIYLENNAGFKFEVRNSNVIEKVTKTMRDELQILLIEAEYEVLTFEI